MNHTVGILTALVSTFSLLFCNEAGSGTPEESFTLRVGEVARVETAGITVRFDEVVSDSRCPKDVNCVRAGEAVVRFTVGSEAGTGEPLQFRVPPAGSDSVRFRDLQITILGLNPQTESGNRIDPSAYEAKVGVTQP